MLKERRHPGGEELLGMCARLVNPRRPGSLIELQRLTLEWLTSYLHPEQRNASGAAVAVCGQLRCRWCLGCAARRRRFASAFSMRRPHGSCGACTEALGMVHSALDQRPLRV